VVSTLKLTKIQIPNSDSDVISLDASNGNITVPKSVTFNGTLGGTSITVQGEGTATTNLQQGLAKSWCRWESIGTASVLDSFNHSSMTDNGTGDQTITIASAMANTTYAHVGMAGGSSTNLATIQQQQGTTAHQATTTAQRYETVYANGSVYDWNSINAGLLGDLA